MNIKEEWKIYPAFRHWFQKGNIYVLSDPHFADPDCKKMDPLWIDPEEQLSRIRRKLGKDDTFLCLGDTGDLTYIHRIQAAKKILVRGNHDDVDESYVNQFDEIYDGPVFLCEHLLLSHEPVYGLSWCLNLHGHLHSHVPHPREEENHVNLAANVWGYEPALLAEFLDRMVKTEYETVHLALKDQ